MIASDQMEPYTARLDFAAGTRLADPCGFVAALLDDIGRRCQAGGASLIGHIKCHATAGESRFHCNLTSLRTGARCGEAGGPGPAEAPGAPVSSRVVPLAPGEHMFVDLAVLVYGLSRQTLEEIVAEALASSGQDASAGDWMTSSE
jgi:hypothetical protein